MVAREEDQAKSEKRMLAKYPGLLPITMPASLRMEIMDWNVISRSPYSNSFYDITNKGWSDDPVDFLRVSDHWNFVSAGKMHAATDVPVANGAWALARHTSDGTYRVLKTYRKLDASDDELVRNQSARDADSERKSRDEEAAAVAVAEFVASSSKKPIGPYPHRKLDGKGSKRVVIRNKKDGPLVSAIAAALPKHVGTAFLVSGRKVVVSPEAYAIDKKYWDMASEVRDRVIFGGSSPVLESSECGAGSPGGMGFMPGNTCAKDGQSRSSRDVTDLPPEDSIKAYLEANASSFRMSAEDIEDEMHRYRKMTVAEKLSYVEDAEMPVPARSPIRDTSIKGDDSTKSARILPTSEDIDLIQSGKIKIDPSDTIFVLHETTPKWEKDFVEYGVDTRSRPPDSRLGRLTVGASGEWERSVIQEAGLFVQPTGPTSYGVVIQARARDLRPSVESSGLGYRDGVSGLYGVKDAIISGRTIAPEEIVGVFDYDSGTQSPVWKPNPKNKNSSLLHVSSGKLAIKSGLPESARQRRILVAASRAMSLAARIHLTEADACGAGSPGGAGFEKGNTCAKSSGTTKQDRGEWPSRIKYQISPDKEVVEESIDEGFQKENFSKLLEDWVHGVQGDVIDNMGDELKKLLKDLHIHGAREKIGEDSIAYARTLLDQYRDSEIESRTKYIEETESGESLKRRVLEDIERDYKKREEWFNYILRDNSGDPELQRENFEKSAKDFIEEGQVAIRVPLDLVSDIVADKRFKSQFESGDSAGFYDPEVRADVEMGLMGVPIDTSKTRRPIYGHVSQPGHSFDNGGLDSYGNVDFVLKDKVKGRTSVAFGDSLDQRLPVSLATSPKAYSRRSIRQAPVLIDVHRHSFPCVEAQVHGQVKVGDVEKVVIDEYFFTRDAYDSQEWRDVLYAIKSLGSVPVEVESNARRVSMPFREFVKDAAFYKKNIATEDERKKASVDQVLQVYSNALAVADEVGIP
ncbi:MAG: hypothetical protein ACK5XN_09480 [Bacteroidota bacterium]